MIYWIIGIILTILTVIGGLWAASANRSGSGRRFLALWALYALGVIILAEVTYFLPFLGEKVLSVVWEFNANYYYYHIQPPPVGVIVDNFLNHFSHPVWLLFFTAVVFSIFSGAMAFHCRKMTRSLPTALGVMAISMILWGSSLVWGLYGIAALVVLSGNPDSYSDIALAVLLILVVLLMICWLVCNWRGKRRSQRVLWGQLLFFAGSFWLCWLLALSAVEIYVGYTKILAASARVTVNPVREPLTRETIQAWDEVKKISNFDKEHPQFNMPYDVHSWFRTSGTTGQDMVSPADREYTFRLFDTPEGRDYFATYEAIVKRGSQTKVFENELLGYLRVYANACAGRALLYCETGEPEKILPELMKIMKIDRQILENQPWVSSERTRNDCRFSWINGMVQAGPDDPLYAPVYREALDFMKTRKLYLPDETGEYLYQLNKTTVKSGEKLMVFPVVKALAAESLAWSLAIRPELKKLEQTQYCGQPLPLDRYTFYQWLANESQISIVMGTAAMALKLYRSEEGKYPATLAELAPRYLDQVPASPFPGHPLVYKSDGKFFYMTLTMLGGRDITIGTRENFDNQDQEVPVAPACRRRR